MTKPLLSPLRTVAGALLALLAFAIAPTAAKAGCFHPLAPTPPGAAMLDALADLDAPAGVPAPSPCDGLRCSSDPAPTPSPSIPASDRAERWGCLAADGVDAPPSSPHPVASTIPLRPSHGGPSPFHPPRG